MAKIQKSFEIIRVYSPFSSPPLLQVKSKTRLNASNLMQNFLSDLAKDG